MQKITKQYERHSIFSEPDVDRLSFLEDKKDLNVDVVIQMIIGQICYILHEPQIVKVRKMLTIEQIKTDCAKISKQESEEKNEQV